MTNKLKIRHVLLVFIFVLIAFDSFSQAQVGGRFGSPFGLAAKYKAPKHVAVEAFGGRYQYGFMGTAVIEYFGQPQYYPGFYWSIGGGAHTGTFVPKYLKGQDIVIEKQLDPNQSYDFYGVNGLVSFEYHFENKPIAVSIDMGYGIGLSGVMKQEESAIVSLTLWYTFK